MLCYYSRYSLLMVKIRKSLLFPDTVFLNQASLFYTLILQKDTERNISGNLEKVSLVAHSGHHRW